MRIRLEIDPREPGVCLACLAARRVAEWEEDAARLRGPAAPGYCVLCGGWMGPLPRPRGGDR